MEQGPAPWQWLLTSPPEPTAPGPPPATAAAPLAPLGVAAAGVVGDVAAGVLQGARTWRARTSYMTWGGGGHRCSRL